jgi:hypothetical protein
MTQLTCTRCKKTKDPDDFYVDKRMRSGKRSWCKVCHIKSTGKLQAGLPTETILIRSARYRARRDGYEFTITEADIVIPSRCPILDIELVRGKGHSHEASPSLDKIDPERGYVPGNIQVISYRANSMKRDASSQELRKFARWVLANLGGE